MPYFTGSVITSPLYLV